MADATRTIEQQLARREVHASRMKRWAAPWRCRLLRLALGSDTFDYMLRSIKADPRTPGARMVDIVVRQDGKERRIEADWVKEIGRMAYHLEPPQLGRKPWNLKRLWCWLGDHGGIASDDGVLHNASRPYCKRCGARVRLIA